MSRFTPGPIETWTPKVHTLTKDDDSLAGAMSKASTLATVARTVLQRTLETYKGENRPAIPQATGRTYFSFQSAR